MNLSDIFEGMIMDIRPCLQRISENEVDAAVDEIVSAKSVFVAGMGRSGYMMRAFAMRLMQLGITTYMVGDTSTPSAGDGDLLIIGSGSGETANLKNYMAKAKALNVRTLVLTSHGDSTLGRAADRKVIIDIAEASRKTADGSVIVQASENKGDHLLFGSLGETCMLLCTEAIVMAVFKRIGATETDMMRRHAVFE